MQQEIIDAVDRSILTLVDLFEAESTRFFTENDLVCHFHRFLLQELDRLCLGTVLDKDGFPHGLVHCEFPTPFRCDMGKKLFRVKTDQDRTERGRGYKRGRFDVVVLNPLFINNHSYSTVKAQNLALLKSDVKPEYTVDNPIVLYGIEFVYCRDEIKPSKGQNWERAALKFVAEVQQDMAKLRASVASAGFMKQAIMLAFVKGTGGRVLDLVIRTLQGEPEVKLITAS